ncbi:MAG: hypothetical protein ACR2NR_17815 [Solirubrobacteraceae bacterium]
MKRIATIFASLAILLPGAALLLPGAALANSTCQSYSSQTCQVSSNQGSRTTATSPTATASASSLPFTGLDVVLLAAGGGSLLGAGLVMRRLSRSSE